MTSLFNSPFCLAGNPENLAEFAELSAELAKLTHPARPDVDWLRVEQLCHALFRHHGAELQTAAAYSLCRFHRQGLQGLCEGLALLEALCRRWADVWPAHEARRLQVLVWLFDQWQQGLRSTPWHGDLGWLAEAQAGLERLHDLLVLVTGTDIVPLMALRQQMMGLVERSTPGSSIALKPGWRLPDHLPTLNTAVPVVMLASSEPLPFHPRRRAPLTWPGLWLALVMVAAAAAGAGWWAGLAPAPEPVSPTTLDLQSLWLFAPGSAELDVGSTSSLVKALVQIQAQPPGRLIVISGHADATGNTQRNQLLSQQRAQAVRDWLQRTGGFADSCFVVQGQGSAKPLEGNVAMAGQGLNRRVDIRLVAVEGGCAASL